MLIKYLRQGKGPTTHQVRMRSQLCGQGHRMAGLQVHPGVWRDAAGHIGTGAVAVAIGTLQTIAVGQGPIGAGLSAVAVAAHSIVVASILRGDLCPVRAVASTEVPCLAAQLAQARQGLLRVQATALQVRTTVSRMQHTCKSTTFA
eukprot:1146063-Pelagomonas_calceolata.AAC.14